MKEEQKEEDILRRRCSFPLPTQNHCSSSQVDYEKYHVSKTLVSKVAVKGLNLTQVKLCLKCPLRPFKIGSSLTSKDSSDHIKYAQSHNQNLVLKTMECFYLSHFTRPKIRFKYKISSENPISFLSSSWVMHLINGRHYSGGLEVGKVHMIHNSLYFERM